MTDAHVCTVCMENIPEDGTGVTCWPSCGHTFHTTCALQCAQYDVRCPMCRANHPDITQRIITVTEALQSVLGSASSEISRVIVHTTDDNNGSTSVDEPPQSTAAYSRMRRTVRRDPVLSKLDTLLRSEHRAMRCHNNELNRLWSRIARETWRDHPQIDEVKKTRTKLRNRMARHTREFEARLMLLYDEQSSNT